MTSRHITIGWLFATASMFIPPALVAADDDKAPPPEPQATTTADLAIPIAELEVMVKPLTADELKIEADAWMKLVRANATAIAAMQVGVRRTNTAIKAAKADDTEAAAKAVEDASKVVEEATTQAAAEVAAAGAQDGAPAVVAPKIEVSDTNADTAKEAAGEAKVQLLDQVAELRTQQTALLDRLNVVLNSWEAKGGDAKSYRQYAAAISPLDVDLSDASAAWATIHGWLVSPEGGQRWAWNIAKFIVVVILTWIVARVLGGVIRKLTSATGQRMSKLAQDAIARTIKTAIWIVGLVLSLTMLEVTITPLLAAIGAAGLVIGLALQGTLSNIASGVMILINRPFDIGDVVTAGGITAKVSEMTLVATVFRSFDNQTIIVPNNNIWGQVITNITANDTRRVDMTFGIGYSDDLNRAEQIIREVVEAHELVLKDPEPMIKMNELAESSVNIVCRPWSKTTDYFTVLCDVLRRVKARFDAEGISIPFPQRDINIRHLTPAPADDAVHAG